MSPAALKASPVAALCSDENFAGTAITALLTCKQGESELELELELETELELESESELELKLESELETEIEMIGIRNLIRYDRCLKGNPIF